MVPVSGQKHWAPPLDLDDLTVRLEAEGMTASVAQNRYGFSDVWAMAASYLQSAMAIAELRAQDGESGRCVFSDLLAYAKGMVFVSPLICCCVSALVFKVSLWGGNLSSNETTAIALATVASFVITAGFIQVIGRQGHFYRSSANWGLCSTFCSLLLRSGIAILAASVALGSAFNAYFDFLPWRLFILCALFFVAIGAYLLVSGVLYVLGSELLIAIATLAGIGSVLGSYYRLHLPLLASQIAGISIATACCLAAAIWRFRGKLKNGRERWKLPAASRLIYLLWPYFVYGCLYYVFLFTDRFMAWGARSGGSSLMIQFRGAYELSLDLCLIAFVFQVGWIHTGLSKFYRTINVELKRVCLKQELILHRKMLRFYHWHLLGFAILSLFSSALVLSLIHYSAFLQSAIIYRVIVGALAGTPFLVVGLWNIGLLFALSRWGDVLKSVAWALGVNVCVGYLVSRLFAYDLAIVGFVCGACMLAATSAYFYRQLLPNIGYHYFAATA